MGLSPRKKSDLPRVYYISFTWHFFEKLFALKTRKIWEWIDLLRNVTINLSIEIFSSLFRAVLFHYPSFSRAKKY